ncbi:hypothetical protein [Bermanella sp. R86510]|uniref:hypothetical protein n=1 Tax=unclassified Bermanella TaxID=2627862 RepID=UPI0037C5C8B9
MKGTLPLVASLAMGLSFGVMSPSTMAEEGDPVIYELSVSTDSDWTSIKIRDDAEWVNAPPGKTVSVNGRSGIKAYSLSPKKVHLRSGGRGDITMNLFVRSKNAVLGLELCKGRASSYVWIRSEQSKQKNDTEERDYCEKAALVLQLH